MYFTTPAQLPGALAIDFSYGILCVPETRYFQSFDPTQLAQISDYYVAYQRNQSSSALCSICRSSHSTTRICLPPIFSNQGLDAFLLVVTGNYPLSMFLHEILSFIQICGYFLLKPQFVFDLLQKNISPDNFTGSFLSVTFLNELQRQGFCETFTYFSSIISRQNASRARLLSTHPYASLSAFRPFIRARPFRSPRNAQQLKHTYGRVPFSHR